MNKRKNQLNRIMYSTNPDLKYEYENDQNKTPPPQEQNLKVCIDKHRAGRTAVIIKDFIGSTDNLKSLSKILKAKCGVGGTAKNGEIIIQGDVRPQVMDILKKEGYNYKRVGG